MMKIRLGITGLFGGIGGAILGIPGMIVGLFAGLKISKWYNSIIFNLKNHF